MRPLVVVLLILSPFIALMQNYPLHPELAVLSRDTTQFVQGLFADASTRMADMVRAMQAMLG